MQITYYILGILCIIWTLREVIVLCSKTEKVNITKEQVNNMDFKAWDENGPIEVELIHGS